MVMNRSSREAVQFYECNVDPKIQRGAVPKHSNCGKCGVIANGTYPIDARPTSKDRWYWGKPLLYVNFGNRVPSLRKNNNGQNGARFLDQITIHGSDSPSVGCIMVNAEGAPWLQFMDYFPIGSQSVIEIVGKRVLID
jgi:hypothetical protein